jgi:hypothetical protein
MVGLLICSESGAETGYRLTPSMYKKLGDYVSALCGSVRIDSRQRSAIDRELLGHLEDRMLDFRRRGLSAEEARRKAIESFGDAGSIARDLYVVHSQGTWRDSFLTSLPHLLVAMLLTAYFADSAACAIALIVVAVIGIFQAASKRAPAWSFSWLGYCLIPIVLVALMLLDATRWWTLVGTAYIPCAVLVVVYVIKETASRDLLYVTLMLAPWAIITAWTLGTQSFVDLQTGYLNSQQLQYYARELVASFVVLAISSFVFARLKPRWGKALALVLPLAAVNGYVVVRLWSEVSLWGLLVSAIAVLLVSVPTLWDFRE